MYNALYDSDDSSSSRRRESSSSRGSEEIENEVATLPLNQMVESPKRRTSQGLPSASKSNTFDIPSYEDLSVARTDEETVLEVVYGEDFERKIGAWGFPRFEVTVRPPDIDPERIGSQLKLSVQLSKKYPYIPPVIILNDVKGLSKDEKKELNRELNLRAADLAAIGSVMIVELVQTAENYLVEHNHDPTMSAWEQMKAREEMEKANELKAEQEIDRIMNSISSFPNDTSPQHSSHHNKVSFQNYLTAMPTDRSSFEIERELARQREAIEAAQISRLQHVQSSNAKLAVRRDDLEDDTDEDDYIDFDQNLAADRTRSRYEADFLELGILGRGGGGEVVKAKNRLDRRVYAVKKIVLESAQGRNASFAMSQNRKLLREVTTISRMTHINIVRYYQAWIEGGTGSSDVNAIVVEQEVHDNQNFREDGVDVESSSSADSGAGWWTNSPIEESPLSTLKRFNVGRKNSQRELSDKISENDEVDTINEESSNSLANNMERADNSVSSEEDINKLFANPLLSGLGIKNTYKDNLGSPQNSDDEDWDESSVKVQRKAGESILYIQMEYCSTTLRELIDIRAIEKMTENDVWRLIRQILDALAYLHSRKVIHRDLKPSNIFLDVESDSESVNVRLGDFGLATTHRTRTSDKDDMDSDGESYEFAINERRNSGVALSRERSSGEESMTGGVGTTFYRAPEQEGKFASHDSRNSDNSSYTVQADIFSFGVILFEVFHPPFPTYMERAETLTTLRGDRHAYQLSHKVVNEFNETVRDRFPESFAKSVPQNAQRMILWCLERDPKRRPSASELLSSDLLPRKIELEQRYLQEALEILTTSQSESFFQILQALFSRKQPEVIDFTFDTDIAAKANSAVNRINGKSSTPSEDLLRAVADIRAGSVNLSSIGSLAMSSSSIIAATAALKRARNAGKLGKGGKALIKRATQRTAGILAMRAAAATAITGRLEGVYGTDPIVLETFCQKLKIVFERHGAVLLKTPLLRPRPKGAVDEAVVGPAELMNARGTVLLLPEDLTAPFARAVGRSGTAASHLKRFDIDRVFHKSMAGGHPRESLEATFDIIYEEHARVDLIEAELMLVVMEVMALLPTSNPKKAPQSLKSPLWYIRLSHTRLADSILDLCGVPVNNDLRRACLYIFSRFVAPAPIKVASRMEPNVANKDQKLSSHPSLFEKIDLHLREAVEKHDLPSKAAGSFRRFLEYCTPLSPDVDLAIETLQHAIAKFRSQDGLRDNLRRTKRFEDAAKSLKCLRDLIATLKFLNVGPVFGSEVIDHKATHCRPLFISLDLGLRQRRQHYHGGTFFQCVILPDDFFTNLNEEDNISLVSPNGRGIKVAEGGNYSELVRTNRPPGNFASSFVNYYTAAPLPVCAGVRFGIGRLMEFIYLDAAMRGGLDSNGNKLNANDLVQRSSMDIEGLGNLRRCLGHPFSFEKSVQCVVASMHGMDSQSVPERFLVAARLWTEGISAEYLPHGGFMLSLIKRLQNDTEENDGPSDWSLLELHGVCALLKIPFIVVVQQHILKEKNLVRLRSITPDGISAGSGTNEMSVTLEDLASTILGAGSKRSELYTGDEVSAKETPNSRESRSNKASECVCVFIDNDQYFGNDREVSRNETLHYKSFLKGLKATKLAAQNFLSNMHDVSHQVPVFAVADLTFFMIRDFGTSLMQREIYEQSSSGACNELIEKFPKQKRSFRTLSIAMDNFMKQKGIWVNTASGKNNVQDTFQTPLHSSPMTVLLYSKIDDRFDMITVGHRKSGGNAKRK